MTAILENRKYTGDGSHYTRGDVGCSYNGPIGANKVLYVGTLAGVLLADTANPPALLPFVGDGTMAVRGIVTVGADNTGGAIGARPVHVVAEAGVFVDKNTGGGNAIGIGNLFAPAYGVDNQTVSSQSGEGVCIGMIVGIDRATGQPVVLVDPILAEILGAGYLPGGGIATAALAVGVLAATAGGRALMAAGFFDAPTVAAKFGTASINVANFAQLVAAKAVTGIRIDPAKFLKFAPIAGADASGGAVQTALSGTKVGDAVICVLGLAGTGAFTDLSADFESVITVQDKIVQSTADLSATTKLLVILLKQTV